MNSSLLWSIPRMVPSALLDASLSSYTYFYSVYVYTFTYCIGENRNKKIETVTLTSLTKIKSVDVLFRRENHKINPLPALNTD